MNFLAHAYLSFGNENLLVGNLITDFIRGKERFNYSHEIQNGIQLHHAIDEFTDQHQVTIEAKRLLQPAMGKYNGVFLDIIYDHFLALDAHYFQLPSLETFSQNTYKVLDENSAVLPEKFKYMFQYMKKGDWLYSYHDLAGIQKSFDGMMRRAKFLEPNDDFFNAFLENYSSLQQAYSIFMPEMIDHAKIWMKEHELD